VDLLRKKLHAEENGMGEDVAAPWQVVFGHHPIYTGGRKHSAPAECLREHSYQYRGETYPGYGLCHVLQDANVAMYLCGHEHVMQYKQCGCVAQCVSGAVAEAGFYGGLGESESAEMDWWDDSRSRGFLAVRVRSAEAVLEFIDAVGGMVMHAVTIPKSPASRAATGTFEPEPTAEPEPESGA
jgi:hypothetical protein